MEPNLIIAILVALLSISEALAFVPTVKANGIFQLITGLIKQALGIFKK